MFVGFIVIESVSCSTRLLGVIYVKLTIDLAYFATLGRGIFSSIINETTTESSPFRQKNNLGNQFINNCVTYTQKNTYSRNRNLLLFINKYSLNQQGKPQSQAIFGRTVSKNLKICFKRRQHLPLLIEKGIRIFDISTGECFLSPES